MRGGGQCGECAECGGGGWEGGGCGGCEVFDGAEAVDAGGRVGGVDGRVMLGGVWDGGVEGGWDCSYGSSAYFWGDVDRSIFLFSSVKKKEVVDLRPSIITARTVSHDQGKSASRKELEVIERVTRLAFICKRRSCEKEFQGMQELWVVEKGEAEGTRT